MSSALALQSAYLGASVAWVAPTYGNSRAMWRFIERAALQHPAIVLRRSEREIVVPPHGGRVGVYSADNDVSIRGEAFDVVIIDEAAQIKEATWTDVIMPTLADRNGHAMLISTPKGKNWFWREFVRGQSDGQYQASFTAPSSANPNPAIRQAASMARDRVSERTYRQEWLAEFVDSGTFFPNVRECATAQPQTQAQAGTSYVIGVDWARSSGGDWTVYTVIDTNASAAVCIERYNGEAFDVQLDRLTDLARRFTDPPIIAEYNSMGGPLVEQLQLAGLNVTGFVTTAASKHELITALEVALDKQTLSFIPDPTLVMELQMYESHPRAGVPSYGAPDGAHDDCVMSLALAYHGVQTPTWFVSGME